MTPETASLKHTKWAEQWICQKFGWSMFHWPLTYWPRNDTQHIINLWGVVVSHIKQICYIAEELQSGQDMQDWWAHSRPKVKMTRVTLTFDLLTLKWYATHHPLMGCICAIYEEIPSNSQEATELTQHAGQTDRQSADGQTDGQGETSIKKMRKVVNVNRLHASDMPMAWLWRP